MTRRKLRTITLGIAIAVYVVALAALAYWTDNRILDSDLPNWLKMLLLRQ